VFHRLLGLPNGSLPHVHCFLILVFLHTPEVPLIPSGARIFIISRHYGIDVYCSGLNP
jgi:hypothetical protein